MKCQFLIQPDTAKLSTLKWVSLKLVEKNKEIRLEAARKVIANLEKKNSN
jgi:hypothetical protein